jgi:hypothetical protein
LCLCDLLEELKDDILVELVVALENGTALGYCLYETLATTFCRNNGRKRRQASVLDILSNLEKG